jgi:hypothetical protein
MDDRNLFAGVAGIAPQKSKIREEEGGIPSVRQSKF